MKQWAVVSGPASLEIGATLAAKLGTKLSRVDTNDFPDGESKVRIFDEMRNKSVIVVQSLYPPTDKHLYLLLLIAHKLSEDGADVSAAIPYLAYARQDREFLKGEVISLGVVAHLFRSVGIRRMVTVDIHSAQGLGLFSIPAYSCSAIPLLAEYISKNRDLNNPIAVSPDFGSSTRVEAFAAVLKSEYVSFKKTRNRETGEIVTEGERLNLGGRDAVIIDDMISTGTSVIKCAHLLKKFGVNKIIAACTHPLMVGGAIDKMKAAGVDELISSNTIPSKYSKVDVAPLLASYFERL
ncbi:MAG TPA: ribose-phosphate pyrophosphokinase [Nitrososphaerales archaeon]|nr:ribose-phosphate pyrophosphokinase [Nitrososphaerales archaeon]